MTRITFNELKRRAAAINALLTACERSKINCTDAAFERVSISKNRTYFFFGARFANGEEVTAC